MLEKLKEELVQLHLELPRHNLVVWTGAKDVMKRLKNIKAEARK
jgi:hypothetical protein